MFSEEIMSLHGPQHQQIQLLPCILGRLCANQLGQNRCIPVRQWIWMWLYKSGMMFLMTCLRGWKTIAETYPHCGHEAGRRNFDGFAWYVLVCVNVAFVLKVFEPAPTVKSGLLSLEALKGLTSPMRKSLTMRNRKKGFTTRNRRKGLTMRKYPQLHQWRSLHQRYTNR